MAQSRSRGVFLLVALVSMTLLATPVTTRAQGEPEEPAKPAVKEKRNLATHLATDVGRASCVVIGVAFPVVAFGVVLLLVAKKLTLRNACFVTGGVLVAGPVWSLLGVLFFMVSAFRVLGEAEGAPNAADLADSISPVYSAVCVGLAMCPIGVVAVVFAAFRLKGPAASGVN